MFARFPHLPDSPEHRDEEHRHRLEWPVLIARLDAERDLRNSLGGTVGPPGIAAAMAEGSFDPQAAEMIFSLAASVRVAGDMPERRFASGDLAGLSRAITDGTPRLPNPKPSDCNNRSEAADHRVWRDESDDSASTAAMPRDGKVSRT